MVFSESLREIKMTADFVFMLAIKKKEKNLRGISTLFQQCRKSDVEVEVTDNSYGSAAKAVVIGKQSEKTLYLISQKVMAGTISALRLKAIQYLKKDLPGVVETGRASKSDPLMVILFNFHRRMIFFAKNSLEYL
jgi:hypothetical protein